MSTSGQAAQSDPARAVVLRGRPAVTDPLSRVLTLVAQPRQLDLRDASGPTSFAEADLRSANSAGARISASEMAAILERRRAIERALRTIDPAASLLAPASQIPWTRLGGLFDAFAGIRGVGFSKMTKALHPKRPRLIPILDSIVQGYLAEDDPGPDHGFAERALALVKGYKRDLDQNRPALETLRHELADRGHPMGEVRILDVLILSVASGPSRGRRRGTRRPTGRQCADH